MIDNHVIPIYYYPQLAQLEVIHPDHKKELLDDMAVIDGIINSCFTKEDNYEELCDMSSQIIHLIKTAEDEGEEGLYFVNHTDF